MIERMPIQSDPHAIRRSSRMFKISVEPMAFCNLILMEAIFHSLENTNVAFFSVYTWLDPLEP
jgi:hypothetical protein